MTELKGTGDALLRHLVHRQSGDVLAGEDDAARARLEHAGDQVEDGGLAGAVGADDGANLAALHRQVDVVDGDEAPNRRTSRLHSSSGTGRLLAAVRVGRLRLGADPAREHAPDACGAI